MVKNSPANAGDAGSTGLVPGIRRCPGGGSDNPLQYSSLENSMDRGSSQVIVHRVKKSQTQLNIHIHPGEEIKITFSFFFVSMKLFLGINCKGKHI